MNYKIEIKNNQSRRTPLCNKALALLVIAGSLTTTSSLFSKDQEDKYVTRNPQSSVRSRERADQQEDFNAKTDPEKFIRPVARSGMKEIRLANLAKQRAKCPEVKQFAEKLIQDDLKANLELKLIARHQNIPWNAAGEKIPEKPKGLQVLVFPEASAAARDAGVRDNSESIIPSSVNSTREQETAAGENGTARGAYASNETGLSNDAQQDAYERLLGLTGKSFDEAYLNHEIQAHTKAVAKFEKASKDLPDGELKQFVDSTLPTLREHLAMAQRMAPPDTSRLNIRERSDRDSKSDLDQANK